MTCPVCGGSTKVYDSRPDIDCVRRRRVCVRCGHNFITLEIDEDWLQKMIRRSENDSTRTNQRNEFRECDKRNAKPYEFLEQE
jgi:transcriptional regulator NrdR family protein